LRWVEEGSRLCRQAIHGLDETAYAAPSALPGWTRKHLVAHLAANAEAIGNLLHWARTGEVTPMYASPAAREADIAAGAALPADTLTGWFDDSAARLTQAIAGLPEPAWQATVRTAQGRAVPASEVPWLRCREVLVHAVDLETGLTFTDLPEDFLRALQEDIYAKRGRDNVPPVRGSVADVTAYLAGRLHTGVTTPAGTPVADLPPWL
jgi:maleylpyruvate isomerase